MQLYTSAYMVGVCSYSSMLKGGTKMEIVITDLPDSFCAIMHRINKDQLNRVTDYATLRCGYYSVRYTNQRGFIKAQVYPCGDAIYDSEDGRSRVRIIAYRLFQDDVIQRVADMINDPRHSSFSGIKAEAVCGENVEPEIIVSYGGVDDEAQDALNWAAETIRSSLLHEAINGGDLRVQNDLYGVWFRLVQSADQIGSELR